MNFDQHTFGNSPAAVTLAKILKTQDRYTQKKVSCTLIKSFILSKEMSRIPHDSTKETAFLMLRNNRSKLVNGMHIPEELKSYMKNVIFRHMIIHFYENK